MLTPDKQSPVEKGKQDMDPKTGPRSHSAEKQLGSVGTTMWAPQLRLLVCISIVNCMVTNPIYRVYNPIYNQL